MFRLVLRRILHNIKTYIFRGKAVISLTVQEPLKLPLLWLPGIVWMSNSPNIKVIKGKFLLAQQNAVGKDASGILTLYLFSKKLLTFQVTIVTWPVKSKQPNIRIISGKITLLGEFDGSLYFIENDKLYVSKNNLRTRKIVAKFPWKIPYRSDRPLMIKTSKGWFVRTDGGLVHSINLKDWNVAISVSGRAMYQHLDYLESGETTYVFIGEYSTIKSNSHCVYRGTYKKNNPPVWHNILRFSPTGSDGLSCRHIHVVTVDHYTGWVWIATGDSDLESAIYVSKDIGESFEVFARGSQRFRTLMILFSKKYIFWNMDTHLEDQSIFRVEKCKLDIVFGATAGTGPIEPQFETVAKIPFGTQWYGHKISMPAGREGILMSVGPESTVPGTKIEPYRDWNPRVFLITDFDTVRPSHCEVLSFRPRDGLEGKSRRYSRVDPRLQTNSGFCFFMAHNTSLRDILIVNVKDLIDENSKI